MAEDDYYVGNDDGNGGGGRWSSYQKDDRNCRVYDHNDFFTVFVQLLLAAGALASLYLKRMKEVPRRTFTTWALDVSKQGVGACYAHVCNMAIAAILSQSLEGETALEDECAWYGLSYLIDTTLGLVLAIMFLRIQDTLAEKYNLTTILHTGVYTGPTACKHWTHQTICWVIILTIVKIMIYYFMIICKDMLAFFGSILFAPLQINIRFELLFVMIFFPGFLNVIYFWIADSYLKAKDDSCGAFEEAPPKSDREMSLISKEEKEAQERADNDMSSMTELQKHQQHVLEESGWGRHTEFIATYLPSWSVFGVEAKPEEEATTTNNNTGSMA
ncbi:entry regulator STIMATE [Seminavis robusta]|uniref:Entry regulator STIMATE n=1 Tax=Seminavis robusta TaxID=568900 RepID=A0A9N8DA88_9STRA|nr:entry regulator STIMATE [Seminavis robusta]|eukprot:Sro54_g032060.1 entry regulator STIMATE (330) ;mRNA; f:127822-128926